MLVFLSLQVTSPHVIKNIYLVAQGKDKTIQKRIWLVHADVHAMLIKKPKTLRSEVLLSSHASLYAWVINQFGGYNAMQSVNKQV